MDNTIGEKDAVVHKQNYFFVSLQLLFAVDTRFTIQRPMTRRKHPVHRTPTVSIKTHTMPTYSHLLLHLWQWTPIRNLGSIDLFVATRTTKPIERHLKTTRRIAMSHVHVATIQA